MSGRAYRDGENAGGAAYDDARASWGFPRFARDFPRDAELDALVVAFTRGDYATVREDAPKLAHAADDDAVKQAADRLARALEPDPTAKILFVLTAALLVFLTAWWLGHDHPTIERGPAPTAPTVEIIH